MSLARPTLARLALAPLLALAATPALAQEKVIFGTNWRPQAEHGGYYQAVADGTYAACGLEVEIRPGGPQVNNRALLLAGQIDFYMGGNLIQAFAALEQDIPFVVVAADFQKEPQALLTHPGAVKSFEEIAGLDKLFVSDLGYQTFYRWLVSERGFAEEKRAPYTFNPAPFIADPRSAQQGYVTSEPFAVENAAGIKPDVWLLADYGFSSYSNTIETLRTTVETRPESVRCFVEGSAIGWANFLYGDNSAGLAAIREANPEMTEAQLAYSVQALKDYGIVDSGDAESLGIGAMTEARMAEFYAKMVAAGVLPAGLDIARAYSLAFTNNGVSLPVKARLLGQ